MKTAKWYGGRPMMHCKGSSAEMYSASNLIDDPVRRTPRKQPSSIQWRCGCGRIHKRAVDVCPACGGRKS